MSSMRMTINSLKNLACLLTSTNIPWKCYKRCSKMETSTKKIWQTKTNWKLTSLTSILLINSFKGHRLKMTTKDRVSYPCRMKTIYSSNSSKANWLLTREFKINKSKNLTNKLSKIRLTQSLSKSYKSTFRATTEMSWFNRYLKTTLFNYFNWLSSFRDPRHRETRLTDKFKMKTSLPTSIKSYLNWRLLNQIGSRTRF
jgi:hypothetical protein